MLVKKRMHLKSFATEKIEHKNVPLKKSKYYFFILNIVEKDYIKDKIGTLN